MIGRETEGERESKRKREREREREKDPRGKLNTALTVRSLFLSRSFLVRTLNVRNIFKGKEKKTCLFAGNLSLMGSGKRMKWRERER